MTTGESYRIGAWTYHPTAGELSGPDGMRKLENRTARVLELMCRRAGEVISHDEFIAAVWGGRVVADHSLAIAISDLRKALGDDAKNPSFIQTVPKRGYRLNLTQGAPFLSGAFLSRRSTGMLFGFALLLLAGWWYSNQPAVHQSIPTMVVTINDIKNETGDKQSDATVFALSELGASYLSQIQDIVVIRHWWNDDAPDPTGGIFERYNQSIPIMNVTGSMIAYEDERALALFLNDPSTDEVAWSQVYTISGEQDLGKHLTALKGMLVAAGIGAEETQTASALLEAAGDQTFWLGQFYWRLGSERSLSTAANVWTREERQMENPLVAAGLRDIRAQNPQLAINAIQTDLNFGEWKSSSIGLLYAASIALHEEHDFAKAAKLAASAIAQAPSDASAYAILAESHIELGNIKQAEEALSVAMLLDPFAATNEELAFRLAERRLDE